MLPKLNRLTREKDFEKTFKQGKKYSLSSIKIYLIVNKNGLKQSRFGFIVSKKISNKAVLRNKIKRRLRMVIRDSLAEIRNGFDIIIISLPGIEDNSFKEIEKNIKYIFKKAGLL